MSKLHCIFIESLLVKMHRWHKNVHFTMFSIHLVEHIPPLITATFVKFSSRILSLLKFAFYYPPFENIYETLKNGNTKFNAAKELMAISLQLQKEKELVFVSIAKKFAALMYN